MARADAAAGHVGPVAGRGHGGAGCPGIAPAGLAFRGYPPYIARFARPVGIGGASEGSTAMKPGIHPEYHDITVIMTDGTQYTTRSCYGSAGDSLRLDIDPKSHPAWTGQHRIIDSGGQVAKFNRKFAGIGLKR